MAQQKIAYGVETPVFFYNCIKPTKLLISFIIKEAKNKVIYPKYSKHWSYTVAHTIDCLCSKMLNHGLNHGLLLFSSFLDENRINSS